MFWIVKIVLKSACLPRIICKSAHPTCIQQTKISIQYLHFGDKNVVLDTDNTLYAKKYILYIIYAN